MARKTAPVTCTICNCRGNVMLHNLNAIKAMKDRITEAQIGQCPKCGGAVSPELLEVWGHCFACQKASQAAKYGF